MSEILWDDLAMQHDNLATACGIDENDGLIVAWLPRLDGVMQEIPWLGGTVYALDGRVIDSLAEDGSQRMKWWKVRRVSGEVGMPVVEPVWQGRAGDFARGRVSDLPRPEGHKLYMRAYSHGPWIRIERADESANNGADVRA